MPKLGDTQQPQKSAHPLDWVPANRNLRNTPLARDGRYRPKWKRNIRHGWRFYELGDVRIYLPLDCGIRRHITGFDMVVLLTLTGLSVARGSRDIRITGAALLECMGAANTGKNRVLLASALRLWQAVSIRWRNWYTPDKRAQLRSDRFDEKWIDRPVLTAERGRIVLDREWLLLTKGYFAQLPTPLPVKAAVLNLLLMIMGKRDDPDEGLVKFKSRREITRRAGIEHHRRNVLIEDALGDLQEWFAERGGSLEGMVRPDKRMKYAFLWKLPAFKVPERVIRKRAMQRRRKARARSDAYDD